MEELRLLAALPTDSWSQVPESDVPHLEILARQGLVVSDSGDPELTRLRQRDDLLDAQRWHPYAAFYHFMSREREKNAGAPSAKFPETEELVASASENAAKFVKNFGRPPSAFHRSPQASEAIDLPLIERSGGFYDVLLRRRTTRAFDAEVPLALEDLSTLLYYVFGCQGYVQQAPGFVNLHKTSPSGGSLHPIEAYPLILDVDSLDTGFYHYNVESHSLELVQQVELSKARALAYEISGQQSHARDSHALITITARFQRNFWKYRQRSLAYASLLLDAGHLSQTFYLVATDLDLGVFFSAVIDGPKIEDCLGLQAAEEGALALWGCGVKPQDRADLGLDFEPYVPRKITN